MEDNRDSVQLKLSELERDLAWLSRKANIPYGTLYYCLVRKQFKISEQNLVKINEALNTKLKLQPK